jgi:aminoglycoside phosphotransferase (APT) family kinase protein
MSTPDRENILDAAVRQFQFSGKFTDATPYGSGHINDTWRLAFETVTAPIHFILQRINHKVFKNPVALMQNIERVTTHLAAQLADDPDLERRVLTLIPTRDGGTCYRDDEGSHWRAYRFIERASSYDAVEFPEQAFQAARAFGRFQQLLVNLPAPRLHDTIPDFHHTPKRFMALEHAITIDVANRAKLVKQEIAFALARQSMTGILLNAGLPERVTHNDTKINNVLLDDATGEGICVIDLDTVMPGLIHYDFGDMVRTATCPAAEDERDLSKVHLQFPMFEALVRGYLSSARAFLVDAEIQHLAFSGKLITFEMGIRFLTDYLAGDTYYKVHRDAHNRDRCRTQFKLVESIEQQEDAIDKLVHSIAG